MKVIAECGCNWTSIKEAKEMIKEAYVTRCWAAKFQAFSKEMAEEVKIPEYLALTKSQAKSLVTYGKYVGINVFFTPMTVERVGWCEEIGVDFIKVRFKDNSNQELFRAIKKTKKKTFISINYDGELWKNFVDYGRGVFLYCVPKYPADYNYYPCLAGTRYLGYSDHTSDLKLLKESLNNDKYVEYFEKHVCLTKDCLEADWSVTFEELKEVLK